MSRCVLPCTPSKPRHRFPTDPNHVLAEIHYRCRIRRVAGTTCDSITGNLRKTQFNVMARIGIVFGLLLFGLTIAGLSVTPQKSYTQFIPMMFGIPMLFFGVVALNPHRRGEAVFAALMLALAGLVIGAGRTLFLTIAWSVGGNVNPLSFQLVAAMTTVCGVFVIVAERWRRKRKKTLKTSALAAQPPSSSDPAANLPPVSVVTRPSVQTENPYQTPAILSEPQPISAPHSGDSATTPPSQPTDSSAT